MNDQPNNKQKLNEGKLDGRKLEKFQFPYCCVRGAGSWRKGGQQLFHIFLRPGDTVVTSDMTVSLESFDL